MSVTSISYPIQNKNITLINNSENHHRVHLSVAYKNNIINTDGQLDTLQLRIQIQIRKIIQL